MTETPPASPDPEHPKRVFIPIDHYLPGFRAGGPIQSVGNLVEALGSEIEFSVATKDRDLGSHEPYPDVDVHAWQRVGNAKVRYLAPRHVLRGVYRLTTSRNYDVLYLNSAFSPSFSLFPLVLRRLGLARPPSVIVAPRGQFSPGALELKNLKKRFFLMVARVTGLYEGVLWQASSSSEMEHIAATMGWDWSDGRVAAVPNVLTAPDIASVDIPSVDWDDPYRQKSPGAARIVFLSRISRMKNLSLAIELLSRVDGDVTFEIFGPIEDPDYWRECQALIATLPSTIRVRYRGEVPRGQVHPIFRHCHLLLLPTRGENFGHVIQEALSSGCPVLISDRTPWRGLVDARAGWDLPLDDAGRWEGALASMVSADSARFAEMSRAAAAFVGDAEHAQSSLEANRRLFELASGSASSSHWASGRPIPPRPEAR